MAVTPCDLFDVRIPRGLASHPERVKEFPLVIQFNVSGDQGGQWTVDTLTPPGSCTRGERADAACTINISDQGLVELMESAASERPQVVMKLIAEGSIDIDGDMMQAMKLGKVFSIAED